MTASEELRAALVRRRELSDEFRQLQKLIEDLEQREINEIFDRLAKMTNKEIAQVVNVSAGTISHWRRGFWLPHHSAIEKLRALAYDDPGAS